MANYSTLAAVLNNPNVLQDHFQDIMTTQNSIIWWLEGKPVDTGAGKKPTAKKFSMDIDGSSRFEVPLMLQSNTNIKAYAKDDTFAMTGNNIGDRAYYNIQSIGGPIPIYRYDQDVSGSSKTNLLNCVRSYLDQADNAVMNLFDSQLNAAGGTEGANDWTSMYTIIAKSPIADNIGGISSAAYPKWQNGYKTMTGASVATNILSYITQYRIAASYRGQRPKILYTTQHNYAIIANKLVANQRYVPDAVLVAAGFEGIEIDGCSLIFGASAQDQTLLGINPDALVFAKLKNAYMKVDSFTTIPGTDMVTSFVRARGNLGSKDRRTSFQLFAMDTD